MEMKKYVAEFIGTMVLVIMGCGTAMTVGVNSANGSGYMLTAFAFGLVIVAMAYCIGNISGCHINPAVSFSFFISGSLKAKEFFGYLLSQTLGAIVGAGVLNLIFKMGSLVDKTGALGSNGLAGVNGSSAAGLLVEIILTFVFTLAILGVTDAKAHHGSFGGLVIGLSLTLVHILGIGLTGTSVNPARSFGPALISLLNGNSQAMSVLWVFILAPFIGAFLSAITYRYLDQVKNN